MAEREARFQVLDRLRGKLPEIPEEKVQNDIRQVIDAVRKPAPEEQADFD